MKKKLFAVFFVCIMLFSVVNISVSAVTNSNQVEEMGVLYYDPENIRITAKQSEIMKFINADSADEKEQALQNLLTDPANNVTEYSELPFEVISVNSVDEKQEAIAMRSPGTWTITPFTISAGAYTYLGPSGGTAFDVAYNETVSLKYYCSPDRAISVECAQSLPDKFYDPDYYSGTTNSWYPGVSGQYRIYFKNFSTATASITGGTIKIY